MGNLRQCGFVPLPVRMGTDANFKGGIGGEPHGRLLMSRHHGAAPVGEDGGPHRDPFQTLALSEEADERQSRETREHREIERLIFEVLQPARRRLIVIPEVR